MNAASCYLGCPLGSRASLDADRPLKPVLRLIPAILFMLTATLVPAQTVEKPGRMGMPEDWTHRHVVFSGGSSVPHEVASAVVADPRFWHQQFRRASRPVSVRPDRRKPKKRRGDWSVNLGGAGSHLAAGTFPAKYTFDINATPDCTNDFAVFALDIAGGVNQATIIAYNNLYTGSSPSGICAGTAPTVKWAYNTGGAINTSPVLSLDGKKVAWVAGTSSPVLHVLTIGTTGSNGTAANSPAPGIGGLINNAVDTTVSFGTLHDNRSSLFVDYTNDVGYVASDDGKLHKFTGVFNGTPTEVGGSWPILGADGANHFLTSPVYDSVSGNIFYGDEIGTFAYIRETASTRGVCLSGSPPCLGLFTYSLTGAIVDAPLVDPVAQNVFVFVGSNGSSHAAVQQTDTQLSTLGPQATIGKNGGDVYAGAFDNNYYISPSTGFLYACGYAGGAATPTLYRIGFNSSGVMNSNNDGHALPLSTAVTQCSPATEIFNPPTLKDWLFVSVQDGCPIALLVGTAGCVVSFDITTTFPNSAAAAQAASGGTSGIVVDNVSTAAQASSMYFSTQTDSACGDTVTSGCAVKLTQSTLK